MEKKDLIKALETLWHKNWKNNADADECAKAYNELLFFIDKHEKKE